jgi:hypothetical protein
MCKKYANFVKNTWQKREAYLIAPAFCIPYAIRSFEPIVRDKKIVPNSAEVTIT